MRKFLISLASVVTIGSASQVMAKPCHTTISFIPKTDGQVLTFKSVSTYPAREPLPKVHKRTGITLRDGEIIKISLKLARKCNTSRYITVKATNSNGLNFCGMSNIQNRGVMDFGVVTLKADCSVLR